MAFETRIDHVPVSHRLLRILWLTIAAGCGRVGFDAVRSSDADADGTDAAISDIAQRAYIKASNTGAGDRFGDSIAMSADRSTLAVGAYLEASAATGVNGDQTDDTATSAGAVYVFTRTGQSWTQQAYLKPSNTGAGDEFGYRVALTGDGSTLVVGAYREDSAATGAGGDQANNAATDAGAVYVFARTGTSWSQETYLKASNTGAGDLFGVSIAISGDSSVLAVGAFGEDGGAVGIGGNQTDNSAPNAGAVYVFRRVGATWVQEAYCKATNASAGDQFGDNVALSSDGATLVTAAVAEDSSGTGLDGNQSDDTANEAGAVYVFARTGTTWNQEAYVKASNTGAGDQFGYKVAMSADGSVFAVGAAFEDSSGPANQADDTTAEAGAVYVFTRAATTWTQQAYVKAPNAAAGDRFGGGGLAFSSNGSVLAISALGEDSAATGTSGNMADDTAPDAGALYLVARSAAGWTHTLYVKASNSGAQDLFGSALANAGGDGSLIAVGAPDESSDAVGIGGNEASNAAARSGAVYVFE